jgi:signal transduction histidine kinase
MKKVLIIEDEASLRVGIADTLAYEGFETIEARDGKTGIQLARQQMPGLIICDIMMPDIDGYGVLIELRSDPATATIPFIFLTAVVARSAMRKGMEFGADDYLTKPFSQEELLGTVKARLEKQAALDEKYSQKVADLHQVMIHSMPHEFRTPLIGILGASKWLMAELGNLEQEVIMRMLETIYRSGERLERLIEHYLLYAQVEVAMLDAAKLNAIRSQKVDEPGLSIQFVAFQNAERERRQNDLVMAVKEREVSVQISSDNLNKIVTELIINACKFSKSGTPIELDTVIDDRHYTLNVTDHGRGMTQEQITNIGAYVQFERTLHEQQGLGLGLILAKRLADLHGGSLTIDSVPGEYTKVSVNLVRVTDEAA